LSNHLSARKLTENELRCESGGKKKNTGGLNGLQEKKIRLAAK